MRHYFLVLLLLVVYVSSILAVELPLSTSSRWIVGADSARVKLACINWTGAHMKDYVVGGLHVRTIGEIASQIKDLGFNCVRLQWSIEMHLMNPKVGGAALEAMPELNGTRALALYDLVISELADREIMIIIDNHVSDANWCCSADDGNGLWYTDTFPETEYFKAWERMAKRYSDIPYVIGADLRNELRLTYVKGKIVSPKWGSTNVADDWHLAATKVANMILEENPHWLIFIQGINYGQELDGVRFVPIELNVSNKLVYQVHDYSWFHGEIDFDKETEETYNKYKTKLNEKWGYILEEGRDYTAPIWVGEIGTSHTKEGLNYYWTCLHRYLKENDLDFAYWPLDGTMSRGDGREFGDEETFGILNMEWDDVAYRPHYESIAELIESNWSNRTNSLKI